MSSTPLYSSDTLRFVAAEVRYPPADQFSSEVPTDLRRRIEAQFPILESATQLTVTVGQIGQPAQAMMIHRFLQRDRLASLSISRDAVTLETTAYAQWEVFHRLFVSMVDAIEETNRPAGVTRVGLRYIDEVRLPDPPADPQGWRGWLDDRVVGPFLITDGARAPDQGTIVLQFGTAPGYLTVLRAAPVASGRAVQEEGPLRVPFRTPDTAYFLLDTDASWADPSRLVPEFRAGDISQTLEELHRPCHALYESVITDRLRREVLTQPRNGGAQ